MFWQYAKIIAASAGLGKKNYRFVMSKYKQLQSGRIKWSTSIREWVKEHERPGECGYCGAKMDDLTVEHILPRSRGGPDTPDNVVLVCARCNLKKGSKRLYEWFGLDRRDEVPRVAEGKYLKLLHELHERTGTLDVDDPSKLCRRCDLGTECPVPGTLSVYCLEGVFLKKP